MLEGPIFKGPMLGIEHGGPGFGPRGSERGVHSSPSLNTTDEPSAFARQLRAERNQALAGPTTAGSSVAVSTVGNATLISSPERPVLGILERFENEWTRAQLETRRKIRALAPEHRSLVELQRSVNELGLQTNLVAQAAEAAGSTVRRLQQLGGAS